MEEMLLPPWIHCTDDGGDDHCCNIGSDLFQMCNRI